MVRESLDPRSRNVAMTVKLSEDQAYLCRSYRSNDNTIRTNVGKPAGWSWPDQPLWIRLHRSGSQVEISLRPEGGEWASYGAVDFIARGAVPLADSLLFGIVAIGNDPEAGTVPALDLTVCDAEVTLPRFIRGDSDGDGVTDLSDAVALLGFMFLGEEEIPCRQAGDASDDGLLDISDPIRILTFLFAGGEPIPPPVEACGVDPTGNDLPCASFPRCP